MYLELYAPIEIPLLENPPVPAAPKAWIIDSNKFIPPKRRSITVIIVKTIYIPYKFLAVSESFGVILPKVGPGTSLCIKRDDSLFEFGKIAKVNTKIPIPPTKWDKDLQKIIECGKSSTLIATDAPEVVKPDTISKKASM